MLCACRFLSKTTSLFIAIAALLALSACGGGGGGSNATTVTVGGTVTGLNGTLVLENNGAHDLTVTAAGPFTFYNVVQGTNYNVTVLTQPVGQTCAVTNGTGTANGNISIIGVACTTNTYSIGGTVTGLSGSLVLQNNGGDDRSVTHDGAFTFATKIIHNGAYDVTVSTQPAGQTCNVTQGSGTATAEVNTVAVNCSTNAGAPPAPALGLVPQAVDLFHFVWQDVAGETEYRLLEDPDSASGYTQIATLAADSVSIDWVAPLAKRVNARYILQACNSVGCTDSNTVDVSGNLAGAVGYFKAHNTGKDDSFGIAVALSADGNTMVVGAYGEASNSTTIDSGGSDDSIANAGAAYVFARSGNAWTQQAYLKASNTGSSPAGGIAGATTGDKFGYAVAVSGDGDTIAVGAYGEDSDATSINGDGSNNNRLDSGAAYVFVRSGGTWTQQAYVKAANAGVDDWFGYSVALSTNGDTLAVGALNEKSNAVGVGGDDTNDSYTRAGAAYVFSRTGSTWAQQAYIKASNTGSNDNFGSAIALAGDGDTLAVTARGEASADGDQANNGAANAGAAYVYTRSGSVWTQPALFYVKPSMPGSGDYFGVSVALSTDGTTLAVGAYGEASKANTVNGDESDDTAPNTGAAYVFLHVGPVWQQQAYIKASNSAGGDLFGISVALSDDGDTLAVGAFFEDGADSGLGGDPDSNAATNAGAAYLFERTGSAWAQSAYVKASNTGQQDQYGYAVALSGDGNQLAVSAIMEDSSGTGVNEPGAQSIDSATMGANSGAVYLY